MGACCVKDATLPDDDLTQVWAEMEQGPKCSLVSVTPVQTPLSVVNTLSEMSLLSAVTCSAELEKLEAELQAADAEILIQKARVAGLTEEMGPILSTLESRGFSVARDRAELVSILKKRRAPSGGLFFDVQPDDTHPLHHKINILQHRLRACDDLKEGNRQKIAALTRFKATHLLRLKTCSDFGSSAGSSAGRCDPSVFSDIDI